jgi:ABC-type sugar transport system substrate-binding protein
MMEGSSKSMRSFFALALAVGMVFVLMACTPKSAAGRSTKAIKTVGVSEYDSAYQFFVILGKGTSEEAKKYGITLNVQDAKADAQRQIQQVENFIAMKVDAIILHTVDAAALGPSVKKAMDAGIPVISVYQKVDEALSSFMIDETQYGLHIGKMAGEWAAKNYAGQDVEAGIMYNFEYQPEIQRMKSCEETFLKYFPTGKVVIRQHATDSVSAMSAAETIMQGHPKIRIFMGSSDDVCGLGISEALDTIVKVADRAKYYVGSADGTDQAIKKIKAGNDTFKGTVDLMPGKVGMQLIDILMKYQTEKKVDKLYYSDFKEVTEELAKKEY